MKNVKMSLANIQGKLSRKELKNIMAGSGDNGCGDTCAGSVSTCSFSSSCGAGAKMTGGTCGTGCYAAYQ